MTTDTPTFEYTSPGHLAAAFEQRARDLAATASTLGHHAEALAEGGVRAGWADDHAEERLDWAITDLEAQVKAMRYLRDFTRTGVDRRNADARRAERQARPLTHR